MTHSFSPPAALAPLERFFWYPRLVALWITMGLSWFVFIEPAPYEYLMLVVFVLFLVSGLRFHLAMVPLVLLSFLYNIGGILGLLPHLDDTKAVQFIATSFYMGVSAVILCAIVTTHTRLFLDCIRNAWILGGTVVAVLGVMGYFDVWGTLPLFAPALRAAGTFKDPNVFSTYLIPPVIFVLQRLIHGEQRSTLCSLVVLLILVFGVFLAFSRGAWAVLVGSVVLLFALSMLLSSSPKQRLRVVMIALLCIVSGVVLLAFLLSFDVVRDMFASRAVLLKDYDAGETGRFANQLRSLPLLLQNPNGLGPFGFSKIFEQNPHNVYLFAFAAYGWLGGMSYLLLIGATLYACWVGMFTKTPFRDHAIAIACPLILMIVQGFQIDTDHWRHFYLLLGLAWGVFVVSLPYKAKGLVGTS